MVSCDTGTAGGKPTSAKNGDKRSETSEMLYACCAGKRKSGKLEASKTCWTNASRA